jgi:hypothetical protein
MKKFRILILAVLLMVFSHTASAHVALIYPIGGETFQAGEIIAIQWQVVINHGPANWDLYFSNDGGSTWQPIVTDLADSVLEYNWTVPAEATNSGQVKVTQDNDTGVDYSDASSSFTIDVSTGIKKSHNLPDEFVLHPAYPNPFNPTTTIRYELFESARVSLKIYNMVGEEIITLVNDTQPPGEKLVLWDAKNNLGQIVASGIYFYQLQVNGEVRTKKLIFMK